VAYCFMELYTVYYIFPCSFAFCLYLSDWPLTTGGESGTSPVWGICSIFVQWNRTNLGLLSHFYFNLLILQFTCIYLCLAVYITVRAVLNASDFNFPFVSSQVREDVLWNYFEPVENVKVDNALHNYTKQRAVETMEKLLETRLNNSHGYIISVPF